MKTIGLTAITLLAAFQSGHAALVAHLTFDDSTDTASILANDGSGEIVWGGSAGITSTADGRFGKAITLTTTSDVYSNQGATNLATTLGLFTVSMHIRQTPGGASNMANWQDFASFGDNNASVFKFELNGAHKSASLYSAGSPGGGTANIDGGAPPTVNDGAWHHLAMVSNGTTMEFFVDGVSKGSVAYAGNTSALDAIQLAGAYGDGRKQNVQIDDLGIWNEALSSTQIANFSINAIPEPSAALLGALGLLALLRRRR